MPSRLGHGLYKKIDGLKNIFRCIYITIPTIPTLPYSCNKYCDLIGHSMARGYSIPSKIKDRLLINQIPDLHYPTIPYNTYITLSLESRPLPFPQRWMYCITSVIRLVTQRPEAVASIAKQSEIYRIAGNFRGRKLSRISRFFSHPRKFSPRNSRHATPIIRSVFAFRESFLREMLLSYRSAKVFSLENFPLYGIVEGNTVNNS